MPDTMVRHLTILLLLTGLLQPVWGQGRQADSQNCDICHDLPMLGLDFQNGTMRSLEVKAQSYNHSIHRNVVCRDCHTDIQIFPHPGEIQKVDCAKACHISRPFALTGFSHQEEAKSHSLSIHAQSEEDSPAQNKLKPTCKYCHNNSFHNDELHTSLRADKRHCRHCHEDEGLSGVLLHVSAHTGHRNAQSSLDVVRLCSSCHGDQGRMKQFDVNLTQVSGFENQFHGKAMKRGLDEVANCMDCHRNHLVLPADDPNSSINTNNLQMTCAANSYCHEGATPQFTQAAIHSRPNVGNNPVVFYTEWGFILLTASVMALLFAHIVFDLGRWLRDRLGNGKEVR